MGANKTNAIHWSNYLNFYAIYSEKFSDGKFNWGHEFDRFQMHIDDGKRLDCRIDIVLNLKLCDSRQLN